MPGQQLIDSFFNVPEITTEIEEVIRLFEQLGEILKSTNTDGFKVQIDSLRQLRNEYGATALAMQDLVDVLDKINKQQAQVNATVQKYTARTEEEIRASLRAKDITKQRTDAIKSEDSAYKALSVSAANYTRIAKDQAAMYGVQSEQAKKATASALALNNQLKAIDASMGQNGRNVGNYGGSLQKLRIGFTDLARAATGEGFSIRTFASNFALVGPVVAIASAALYGFIELLKRQTDAQKLAAAHQKILREQQDALYDSFKNQNEAAQTAIRQATDEQVKVELLVTALKQHNLTRKEQIEAVNKLKEISPAYFNDLDAEHLKIDTLTKDYNNFNGALIAHIEAQLKIADLTNQVQKRLTFETDFHEAADEFDKMLSSGMSLDQIIEKTQADINNALISAKGLNDPNALKSPTYFNASAVNTIARDKLKEQNILKSIGQVSPDDLGLKSGGKSGPDNTNYEEGFKGIREDIAKTGQQSAGIDMDPYHKELNDALVQYKDFYTKIDDLRKKDDAKVAENLAKGIINDTSASSYRLKIHQDELNAKSEADKVYQDKLTAINDKFLQEIIKNQKEVDDEIKKGQDDETKKTQERLISGARAKLQADQKIPITGFVSEYNKNNKIAEDQRDISLQEAQGDPYKTKQANTEYDESKKTNRLKLEKDIANATIESAKVAIDTVSSLEKAAEERRMIALQKQMEMQQRMYDTERKNVENSTESQQKKAAKLNQLDQQNHARQLQLQAKERKEKIKDAEFAKKAAMFNIILSTVEAVLKAAPNVPLEIITAATGAAALAVAAAQPIPKYAVGTDYAKGGPSIVGEQGRELVMTPRGDAYYTPDSATLTNLPKGSKVIPNNELNRIMQESTLRSLMFRMPQNSDKKFDELKDVTERGDKEIVKAIQKIKITTHQYKDMSSWRDSIRDRVFK